MDKSQEQAREKIASRIREGLIKDFNTLYVKEYTTTWEVERVCRETEIDIMSLENTVSSILCGIKELGYQKVPDLKALSARGINMLCSIDPFGKPEILAKNVSRETVDSIKKQIEEVNK